MVVRRGFHTFYKQSAHRWRLGCQPHTPTIVNSWNIPVLIYVKRFIDSRGIHAGRNKLVEKFNGLIGNSISDFPACIIKKLIKNFT
jgi:hypothetical protein